MRADSASIAAPTFPRNLPWVNVALLRVARDVVAPVRPEDVPDALIATQTEDQPGAYCGPYEAGAVWAVVEGSGVLRVDGRELTVAEPGCIAVVEHGCHTTASLEL